MSSFMSHKGSEWKPCWWCAIAVVILIGGTKIAPGIMSLYYQERGGRLLKQALSAERDEPNDPLLLLEPLTTEMARGVAEQALLYFREATRADRKNSQAYRWTGRTDLLLDRPGEAIEAFSEFTRQRPKNPLGYWELGLAYERLAYKAEQVAPIEFALDSDIQQTVMVSSIMTTTSPLVAIKTPDVPIDTPYCEPGEEAKSCFVALTAWEMPVASGSDLRGWWVPVEPVQRRVLFMHPPSAATFTVTLPVSPTALVFWMGIDPAAWGWMGDGVVYKVEINGDCAFERYLTAEEARQGWWPGEVNLSSWAGRKVQLTLETTPGPAGNGQGDWAGWGEVQLVKEEAADTVLTDPVQRASAAWREGGITVQQLLDAGEAAQKAKEYEEALGWYKRATWMEPDLGDPWYDMGLVYERMEEWTKALAAYEQAVEVGRFTRVHRSSPYYRMGIIYWSRLETKEAKQALAALEQAIEVSAFGGKWEEADAHYQRGVILKQQGVSPEEYVVEFERAVEIDPQHVMAHVLLGTTYYALYQDVGVATEEIEQALKLNPRNKWAYLHLGDVYQQAGMCEEAEEAYRRALELDPEFGAVRNRLQSLTCDN